MHDLNLFIWQRVRVPVAVPVKMEDICYFPLLPIVGGIKLSFFIIALLVFMKSIKRAFEFGETFRYEMKIYDCGFYG